MGGSSDIIQRAMGGLQIGTGIAATAMGQPMVGIPMMASGISGEVKGPNQDQGPLSAGLGGAINLAGGAAGLGSSALQPTGTAQLASGIQQGISPGMSPNALSSVMESMNPGSGVGIAQTAASPGFGSITPSSFNSQALSQMLGGTSQALGQGASFMNQMGGGSQPTQTQPPPPTPVRPLLNMQNAPQQMATPQMAPGPQIPQQPQNPQIQALLMRMLGGQGM